MTVPRTQGTEVCQHSWVIPTVSLAELDSNPTTVGEQLVQAYSTMGFAYVSDHSIAADLIDRAFHASRDFHALSLVDKMRIEMNDAHRGYLPMATSTDRTSTLGEATRPNVSESFLMLHEVSPDHRDIREGIYLAGPNQWPASLPDFRNVIMEYQTSMQQLALLLIRALDTALGLEGRMARWFDEPTTWLRLLHYPPQDQHAPEDEFGSAPHTDFGAITLLAQDDVGGLSVRSPHGDWWDVEPRSDTFVMNVGDVLSRWSGGLLRSTPHRVTNRTGRERFSIPFFFDPSMRAPLDLESPDSENFADYVRHHLEGSYDHHQGEGA